MKLRSIYAILMLAVLSCLLITGCGKRTEQEPLLLAVEKFLPQSNNIQGFERASVRCFTTTLPDTQPGVQQISPYGINGMCQAQYIGQSGTDVVVAIYDMGTVTNSFGAWSLLDTPMKKRAEDGLSGCMSDFCLDFYRDQYVVMIKVEGDDPAEAQAVLRQFSSWVDGKIGGPTQQPPLVEQLPSGYVEGSLKYFVNTDSLNAIYPVGGEDPLMLATGAAGVVAGYSQDTVNSDAGTVTVARDLVFVVEYPSENASNLALQAFKKYIDYYNTQENGYSIIGLFNEPKRIMVHRNGKLESVVYQSNNYIFGAWQLQDDVRRDTVLKALIKNLQAASAAAQKTSVN